MTETIVLRPLVESDRPRIREILVASGRFSDEEIGWALKMLDAGLAHPLQTHVLVAQDEDTVLGWASWQSVRALPRTSELCWISVDPAVQRQGIGSWLVSEVEKRVHDEGGRWLLVETRIGRDGDDVREFYQRRGYGEVSRIIDFQRKADDRLILIRRLDD